MGDGEFAVDEGVVEARGGGVGGSGGVENFGWARPIDGAEAHRTGFAGGEKLAVIELKRFEPLAGFTNGNDFGVGGGVVRGSDAVGAGGDESAILGDDCGERAATI